MKIVRAKTVALFLAAHCLGGWGRAEPIRSAPDAPGIQKSRLLALRVVGSNVRNPQGEFLGRIEETAVNPATGQIEFAMLQIHYPKDTTRVTPVPWKVLNYVWDQSQSGGLPGALQTFNLNMSRAQLERAPTLDRARWPILSEAYWAQRIFAYYGVSPNAGLATGITQAQGAAAEEPPFRPEPERSPYELGPYVASGAANSVITDTNIIGSFSNAPPFHPIPPGATNAAFNTNIFLNRTNFFLNGTNFFLNRTNFFPGTRTPFNPEDPSTFPRQTVNTNMNVATRPSLPAPAAGDSPWSPQLAGTPTSGDPSVAPQPNPWSPRFLPPNSPSLPINPQPNPWSPRFTAPDDNASLPINPQPNPWSPRFVSPGDGGGSMPVSSQPNTFSPQFSAPQTAQGPSASQGAGSSAWAPVFRGGGGGGGGRRR